MEFVDVAVPRPVWNTYTYAVSKGVCLPENPFGIRVRVPFKNSYDVGWIVSRRKEPKTEEVKSLLEVVDLFSPFCPYFEELMFWTADYFFSPLGMLLQLAFPESVPPIQEELKRCTNFDMSKKPSVLMDSTTNRLSFYIEKISDELKACRQVILLFPDRQILKNNHKKLKEIYPDEVVLWTAERIARVWHLVRNGEKRLILGTRRAIFAPASELGLIIVDGEASENYWQDRVPFYNAQSLAVKRANLQGCRVILGDSMPLSESVFKAAKRLYTFARKRQPDKRARGRIEVVDLRIEKRNRTVTERMVRELKGAVRLKKQSIVFVNRRGYASFIVCGECGFVPRCPDCSISLTYYREMERTLKCKLCGYTEALPDACPVCGGINWFAYSAGVEQVTEILKNAIPNAKIKYIDSDLKKRQIDSTIKEFMNKELDVLVSTVLMLSYLQDYTVDAIYILQADMFINISDFRAGERSYRLFDKLLEYVSPRGKLVVQTFDPSFPIIRFFAHQNRWRLYRYELANRESLSYPPFSYIVAIEVRGKDEGVVKETAEDIAKEFYESDVDSVLGPVRPIPGKVRGIHRLRVVLKDRSWKKLHSLIKLKHCDILLKKRTKVTVIVDPLIVD